MSYLLNSVVSGSGQPIVLLHGLAGSARYWDEFSKVLSKNYRAFAIDLLGFGRSPKPRAIDYTIEDHIESIIYTLKRLKITDPVILVGFSTGAIIAAALAGGYSQLVKKLILVSPPVYESPAQAKKYLAAASPLPEHLLYGPTAKVACLIFCHTLRPLTRQILPLFLKSMPRGVAQDSLLHTWRSYSRTRDNVLSQDNVVSYLADLSVPSKLIYGQEDEYIVPANIEKLEGSNPNLELIQIAGGHQLPLESPTLIVDALVASAG